MSKQPLEDKEHGIHRAKLWEIGFFACNNLSTNLYMILMMSISYYLIGIVGLLTVVAGTFSTALRIWDGVTDPFVGLIIDKTNGKFGKSRPFIVIGQLIMFCMTFLMFRVTPMTSTAIRFIFFTVCYLVYILGYTAQCVVTKAAQPCLTNDPKQRPIFAMFDSVFMLLCFSLWYPVYLSTNLVPRFTLNMAQHADKIQTLVAQNPNLQNCLVDNNGVTILNGFYNPELWQHFQIVIAIASAVLAVLAIIGLWRKDRTEYFGAGESKPVGFKDYIDVMAHNRGIQMLVVAASSDKLCLNGRSNSAVMACLYGVVFGAYALYGSVSQLVAVPALILTLIAFNQIASKLGQKKCLVYGSWGSIICALATVAMIIFGAQKNIFSLPTFSLVNPTTWGNLFNFSTWSLFGLAWVLILIISGVFNNMASNIVITMTADCADYETYRTGRYVPGLIGTLFSFVDKIVSSFGTTIVAAIFALVGFADALPTDSSPYSTNLMIATIICFVGLPIVGWLCNVIAMKFYPLTKEKMEEVQEEIARIKTEAIAKQNAEANTTAEA